MTEDPAMSATINQNPGASVKKTKSLPMLREAIAFHLCLLLSCSVPPTASDVLLAESIRWYTGENGQVDHVLARDLLEQSVTEGDSLSVMWLARVYISGRMTFPQDQDKAQKLANSVADEIEALAHVGNAEAMFLLGTAYAEGLGRTQDESAGVRWYRAAAEKGHTLAQHNLGNVYFEGIGVQQSDQLAVQWWTLAAKSGDAIPQVRLAEMYEQGRGVSKDISTALCWYRKAAQRGDKNAVAAIVRLQNENQ